jgi:SAM-dependent methyltransferase
MNPDTPSPWLLRWLPQLRAGQTALDLACGAGRHTRALAAAGLRVTAIDRQPFAWPGVECLQADLEQGLWPLAGRRFDLVLVTHYLWRPRFADVLDSVDDWFLHETFAVGQEQAGTADQPRLPAPARRALRALPIRAAACAGLRRRRRQRRAHPAHCSASPGRPAAPSRIPDPLNPYP